jgi:hypothetical protein
MENMEFLKAMLVEMNANTKAMQETMDRQLGSLVSNMDANRKRSDRR